MSKQLTGLLVSLLLSTVLLSGCFGGDEETDEPDTGDDQGDDHDDQGDDGNQTDPQPINGTALLDGSISNGSLPLEVNFTIGADPAENVTGWSIDFGDGTDATTGDAVPGATNHTYNATGNYTATLTVTFDDDSSADDTLTIKVLNASADAPADLHVDYEGTHAVPFPAGAGGGFGLAPGNPVDQETDFCGFQHNAESTGTNGTSVTYFKINVPAGATRVYIEGGAEEVANDQGVLGLSVPDFDVFLTTPSGECPLNMGDHGTGSYESAWVEAPEPGEYILSIIYWAGPPEQGYTGFYEINYGSFINPPTG